MRQQTFADEVFERYRKVTRREQFLEQLDAVVPWRELCEVIEPFYPKPEGSTSAICWRHPTWVNGCSS